MEWKAEELCGIDLLQGLSANETGISCRPVGGIVKDLLIDKVVGPRKDGQKQNIPADPGKPKV